MQYRIMLLCALIINCSGFYHIPSANHESRLTSAKPLYEDDLLARAGLLIQGTGSGGQTNFDKGWGFYRGDIDGAQGRDYDDSSWRRLDVPHDFSIEGSFDKNSPAGHDGASLSGGIGWYRKTFNLPRDVISKQIVVRFDGVYMNSDVWFNGKYLGNHPYGYTTFEYNLTPYISADNSPNVLAVRVNSQQPNSRWYTGTGIYRHVWLIGRELIHIEPWSTAVATPVIDAKGAAITVQSVISNDGDITASVVTSSTIKDDAGQVISVQSSVQNLPAHSTARINHLHQVVGPKLWSIENPTLYTMHIDAGLNGISQDRYVTQFGVRSVRFDADHGMFLNGRHVKIQGVCMHHDLGSLGAALNDRALERQLEILKSMGTNAIRTSHNPPAPELLTLADRMGFLVMDEAFDVWRTGKVAYDYHLYFDRWAESDIKSMVRRDRNHPSVIIWSIGNEIPDTETAQGVNIARQLRQWVLAEDTTRPVTIAENKMDSPYARQIADFMDLVGYNYFPQHFDPDHKEHTNWKLYGSETSSAVRSDGVYHMPVEYNILTDEKQQCSSYDNSIVPWGNGAEDSWRIDREREFVAGEFIWTGFDYLGEPTPYSWPAKSSYFGIINTAGFAKDIFYFYKSQWTHEPLVHILPHWNWTTGQTITVFAYSNAESVELFLNDRSLGKKSFNPTDTHLRWDVVFTPGTLRAIATNKGEVVAIDEVRTAGNAAAITLKADRSTIKADGKDLVFVEANIVDAHHSLVPGAEQKIYFNVEGDGAVIGVDNGNPISHEPYQAGERQAFNGKALAVIKSARSQGHLTITAISPDGDKNLAAGMPASADSSQIAYDNTPDKAVSDSEQGRWCANDDKLGHYWQVDLGKVQKVAASKITWEKHGFVYQYVIDVSQNGSQWQRVVDKTRTTATDQVQWDIWSSEARYVRVTITGLEPNVWASIAKFKLVGSLDALTSNSVRIDMK